MNIFINLRSSVPPLFILFTKTQKRKNQTRVCPPIFQLPLITSPRYPYPQCPKPPFIMSHFAFWGIPFRLLGYIFGTFAHNVQPDFRFAFFVFRCKICAFSLSIGKIDLAPFCIFVILHFCNFVFLHFANAKLLPFGN